jgi:CBS domain-containing protein
LKGSQKSDGARLAVADGMPRTVDDIMNKELLSIRPDLPAREVPAILREFGIGAAPVLDERRKPVGVVSLHDKLDREGSAHDVMTRPAECVSMSATIEAAARQMARGDRHHLVVVDGNGAAVGMVSTLDVLRALLDIPARHPVAFPHWDPLTRTSWTDDWPLDDESHRHAPDGAGVLVLVTFHRGQRDAVAWAEASANLRARVREFASQPARQEPALARVLASAGLHFRTSSVEDPAVRDAIVAALRTRLDHQPHPGDGTF